MATIRSFDPDDLPAVQALMRADPPGWTADERLLKGTLIEHPWADPDLPSLVAIGDDNEVVGFIGAHPRVLRLGDRRLRGVCCSHLVVVPDRRAGAAGALLLKRLLSADQELTWSDSASDIVVRMWRAFGGHLDHARACDWMLVLRPARWLGGGLGAALHRERAGRQLAPVAAVPFQAAGRRLARRAFPSPSSDVSGDDASVEEIVDALPALVQETRLQVDHHLASLRAVIALVGTTLERALRCRVVRRGDRPIGWYAYLPRPGGVSRVLHLDALQAETESVFGELIESARAQHSAVLAGRMEPHLEAPLHRRFAVLGFARRPVIHTRDLELRSALATDSSLLTQLDSEWWVP
jgi:hypothetical protein